jgi:hypothetical protein
MTQYTTASPPATNATTCADVRLQPSRLIIGWMGASIITIFIAVFGLQRSFEIGRLSAPPWYDDVYYLYTTQALLHAAGHQSWLETLRQFIEQHAPLSTLLGVIGFLAVPNGLVGPYVANCLVLGGFLIGCVILLRPLPTLATIGIIAAIGAIPVASLSITEFRPDFAWGFLNGLAATALLRPQLFAFNSKRLLLIGWLCGLALVSKPSASPATVAILAVAFGGAVLLHLGAQEHGVLPTRAREVARAIALIGLGAVIVAGPVYALTWRQVYDYIKLALFDLNDQNTIAGDLLFHVLYYSTGDGGRIVLGNAFWVLLAFWITVLAYAAIYARRSLPRLMCYLAVIVVAYALPSQTVVKSLFFGGAFYGVLIVSSVAVTADLWRQLAQSRTRPVLLNGAAGLIGAVGVALLVATNAIYHPVVLMAYAPDAHKDVVDATAQIWPLLRDHVLSHERNEPNGRIYNVMVLSPEPVTAGALSLYAATEDIPLRAYGFYYARTLDELVQQLKTMDFVVVTNSIPYQLYGPRLGDALMETMDLRADFMLILSYPRAVGGIVKVYEHKA